MKLAVSIVLLAAALVAVIAYSQYRGEAPLVSGFVEADLIRLGSRVGGRVARVLVDEGYPVRAGQVLVELEPFDLLELREEAAATLAARQAELDRLQSGLRSQEIAQQKARFDQLQARLSLLEHGPRPQEIEAARARLRAAHSELKLAQQSHERLVTLTARNAASQEELDRVIETLQAAQARVDVSQQELDLLLEGTREEEIAEARAQLEQARQTWQLAEAGFREEEIRAAQAARDAAQAALDALQLRIDELNVTAPIVGVVQAVELNPGDLVPANAPVLSILDASHLWIRAYVPEDRLDLQLGQRLPVTVDSFPGETFPSEVVFISQQAEFTPSNVQTQDERVKQVFRIKLNLLEGLDRLRPGMAADVHLKPRSR